ncbi:catalase [Lawsonella clevelandensis]|uniref:Catalase n=4 Tax=Lawsonella clevelandensis TaxID=1528099 RepID=A0A0M5L7U5_9ACTN|nr:catalase [Lawsonella clevelandensis]ALE19167.1 catalase [Lawsonella clevelandensis]ALE34821.1 catalase [Lawsonella clevelandensis]MDU7193793.1 catalase [Lawsonella clevelandensis]
MTNEDPIERGLRPAPHNSATTTAAGAPVASDDFSLQQGKQGYIGLHDVGLIDKLAHFDRERTPERVVHAKGSGAFGIFDVTEDVSAYTAADFLQPGKKTPVLARFSTVAGEKGAADTQRDPRGFALKFYTEEGNYDMVGNNTPVFFIRDAIKFPDFIHSQKRTSDTDLQSFHMRWDFWTLSPESAHQVAWLFGDRGLPSSFREMDGFSSHSYQWINAKGERFWVKYHFKTDQGIGYLSQAEADKLAGSDPEYHRRDLYQHIQDGDYPSWTLKMQIMPEAEAENYKVNPFDITKTWSQKDYPLIPVGKLTLNQIPKNFHVQIEQAAFSPSNLVRGIGFSPDKMLLGRVFSYPDTQRHRLGANFEQLPPNRPVVDVNNYSHQGPAAMEFNDPSVPTYVPNSGNGPTAQPELSAADLGRWEPHGDEPYRGYPLEHEDDDFWSQPHVLVREVMDDAARERLVSNVVGTLDEVQEPVLSRVFEYWKNIDGEVGAAIEKSYKDNH